MAQQNITHVEQAIKEKTIGYITAALGLVAGLAWNDAIKTLIDYFFPFAKSSLVAKLLYATIMTIIVAIFSFILLRWSGHHDTKKPNEK